MDVMSTLAPRVAARADLAPGLALRASWGRAFRLPNLMESHLSFNQYANQPGMVFALTGNPEIQPESMTGTELGIHAESPSTGWFDLAIWRGELANEISVHAAPYVDPGTPPQDGVWVVGEGGFINGEGSQVAQGIEVEGRLFPQDGLDIRAQLGWTSEDIDQTHTSLRGLVGLDASVNPQLHLGIDLVHTGTQSWSMLDEAGDAVTWSTEPHSSIDVAIRHTPTTEGALQVTLAVKDIVALASGSSWEAHPLAPPTRGHISTNVEVPF